MHRSLNVVVLVALLFSLMGCSGNQAVEDKHEVVPMDVTYIPKNRHPIPMSNRDSMFVSKRLVAAVEELDVVEKAQVIILNQEAYVAVWTDISGKGTLERSGQNRRAETGTALNEGMDLSLEINNRQTRRVEPQSPAEMGNRLNYEGMIQEVVFQANPSIQHVYVSFEPEVYRRMKVFADALVTNGNNDSLSGDFEVMTNQFFEK